MMVSKTKLEKATHDTSNTVVSASVSPNASSEAPLKKRSKLLLILMAMGPVSYTHLTLPTKLEV